MSWVLRSCCIRVDRQLFPFSLHLLIRRATWWTQRILLFCDLYFDFLNAGILSLLQRVLRVKVLVLRGDRTSINHWIVKRFPTDGISKVLRENLATVSLWRCSSRWLALLWVKFAIVNVYSSQLQWLLLFKLFQMRWQFLLRYCLTLQTRLWILASLLAWLWVYSFQLLLRGNRIQSECLSMLFFVIVCNIRSLSHLFLQIGLWQSLRGVLMSYASIWYVFWWGMLVVLYCFLYHR